MNYPFFVVSVVTALALPTFALAGWTLTPQFSQSVPSGSSVNVGVPIIGTDGIIYFTDRTGGGDRLHASPGGIVAQTPGGVAMAGDRPYIATADSFDGRVALIGQVTTENTGSGFLGTGALFVHPGPVRQVDYTTTIPGIAVARTMQFQTGTFAGNGALVFEARQSSPSFNAICSSLNGVVSVLVRAGSTLAPGGGTFTVVRSPVSSGGTMLFYGEVGTLRGIYELVGSSISPVITNQSPAPTQVDIVSVNETNNYFSNDGGDLVIVLDAFNGGVFKRVSGVWSKLVSQGDPIPGGVGNFAEFREAEIKNSKVVFTGGRNNQFSPPTQFGIYTDLNGPLEVVADLGSNFGGLVPTAIYGQNGNARFQRMFNGSEVTFLASSSNASTVFRATPSGISTPQITAITLNVSTVTLTWNPFGNGTSYTVQSSPDLGVTPWMNAGATSGATTTTVPRPTGAAHFFRISSP